MNNFNQVTDYIENIKDNNRNKIYRKKGKNKFKKNIKNEENQNYYLIRINANNSLNYKPSESKYILNN